MIWVMSEKDHKVVAQIVNLSTTVAQLALRIVLEIQEATGEEVSPHSLRIYLVTPPVTEESVARDTVRVTWDDNPLSATSTLREILSISDQDLERWDTDLVRFVYSRVEVDLGTWNDNDNNLLYKTPHTVENMLKRRERAILMSEGAKVTPSDAAKNVPALYEKAPFWDCRMVGGRSCFSAPIETFEPAFGRISEAFVRTCQDSPDALIAGIPQRTRILECVHDLAACVTEEKHEAEIDSNNLQQLFSTVGKVVFQAERRHGHITASGEMRGHDHRQSTSDGAVCARLAGDARDVAILSMVNKLDHLGGDPTIQSATFLRNFFTKATYAKHATDVTACPSIIIAMIGTEMKISGLMLTDRWMLQGLTPWMEFGESSQAQNMRIIHVAYVLVEAYRVAAELARMYESRKPGEEVPADVFFFPQHNEIILSDGPESNPRGAQLKYQGVLGWQEPEKKAAKSHEYRGLCESRALFEAIMSDQGNERRVVVKFTTSYNEEAHKLLADKGLAPTLHFCKLISEITYMVVMDYGEASAWSIEEIRASRPAKSDIKEAVKLLHAAGFVFGDLTPQNILLKKGKGDEVTGAMLVDFDWCGKSGSSFYRTRPNREDINFAPGVDLGEKMQPSHDNHWLKIYGIEV